MSMIRIGKGQGFASVTIKSPVRLLNVHEHIGFGNGDLIYLATNRRGFSLVICEAIWLHSYDYVIGGWRIKLSIGKRRRWLAGIELRATDDGWKLNREVYHA